MEAVAKIAAARDFHTDGFSNCASGPCWWGLRPCWRREAERGKRSARGFEKLPPGRLLIVAWGRFVRDHFSFPLLYGERLKSAVAAGHSSELIGYLLYRIDG